jgi:hypothetical protein
MQFWCGVWMMFNFFFSLFVSSECVRKEKLDKPIIHWFLGFLAGVGVLCCFILGIWG